jgi:hypothetical protein
MINREARLQNPLRRRERSFIASLPPGKGHESLRVDSSP